MGRNNNSLKWKIDISKKVEILIKDLKDEDPLYRERAAEILGEIGDVRAIEPLIEALKDWYDKAQEKAVKALVKIREPAVEYLIQALKDKDISVRKSAVKALGLIGNSRAVEPLKEALKDEDSGFREEVEIALSKIGDSQVVEPLIQSPKDNDQAAKGFAIIGKLAVEHLIQALKDKDISVRTRAIKELGMIGDSRAVEPLKEALKDKDWNVKENAAWALGEIGDTRAIEPLVQYLKNEYFEGFSIAPDALDKLGWKPINDEDKVYYFLEKKAYKELIILGEPAVELFSQALKRKDSYRRLRIIEALFKIDDLRTFKFLVKMLLDEDSDVRKEAAEFLRIQGWEPENDTDKAYYFIAMKKWNELIRLGEPAVEPLIWALKDADYSVQWEIVEVLGKIGDERAVEPLIQLLKGELDVRKNPEVEDLGYWEPEFEFQERIAEAIGKIGGTKAVELLIQELGNVSVEEWIAMSLRDIPDPRAVEPLIQTLEKGEYRALKYAAEALGKIGDVRAIKPLIQTLRAPDVDIYLKVFDALESFGKLAVEPLIQALKDKDPNVQSGAVLILISIGDSSATERLIQLIKDKDRDVRIQAIHALEIGDERAVKPLIEALKDEDNIVRKVVASTLGKIGGSRAVEALIEALKDDDFEVRIKAMEALENIGDVKAVESLNKTLKDENEEVCKAAKKALEKIKKKNS